LPDMPGYRLRHTLRGPGGGSETAVACVRFDQAGRRLASGGNDGTAYIWNVDTGELLHTLKGHRGGISGGLDATSRGSILGHPVVPCSMHPSGLSLCATMQMWLGRLMDATWPQPQTTPRCECGTLPPEPACAFCRATPTLSSAVPSHQAPTCWWAEENGVNGSHPALSAQAFQHAEAPRASIWCFLNLACPRCCKPRICPHACVRPSRSAAALTSW
jgi:hypothetical protein